MILGDYPEGSRVELGCRRCERRGSYRIERLIERYGADRDLPTLLHDLSADCRRRGAAGQFSEPCGALYRNPPEEQRPPKR